MNLAAALFCSPKYTASFSFSLQPELLYANKGDAAGYVSDSLLCCYTLKRTSLGDVLYIAMAGKAEGQRGLSHRALLYACRLNGLTVRYSIDNFTRY